ncbi:MAG: arylsulfatase, partial [Porticoccaceae bacterium]|nr:arylsulfatase [Porticoccaceae bacterium]
WPDDIFIQVSESQTGRAVRTARWKYSVCSNGEESALKGSSEAYEEEFLYDLKADPYELNNLIGNANFREVGDLMMERLLKRIRQIENEQPNIIRAKTQNPKDWQQRRPEIGNR